MIASNDDLSALQKAAANAYRLYTKTRPPPSLESSKRAKGFSREGIHPSLRDKVESPEAQLAAITERLKQIRFNSIFVNTCYYIWKLNTWLVYVLGSALCVVHN